MSNVVEFVRREAKARSRNRKEALSVIIPQLMKLKEEAGPVTDFGGDVQSMREVKVADLCVYFSWMAEGLNIVVHTGAPLGGPGQFPRVFAVYLDINAPTSSASVASWKRGDWEEKLFMSRKVSPR